MNNPSKTFDPCPCKPPSTFIFFSSPVCLFHRKLCQCKLVKENVHVKVNLKVALFYF